MARFHCYKNSATSGANLIVRNQLAFNNCPIISRLNHARHEFCRPVRRSRTQQLDRILSRDCTRRLVRARLFHQMPRCRPVAVTIEQRADDSATQHPLKRFVLLARLPFSNNFIAIRKAADVQALRIRRPTSKTGEVRRVRFLNALHWFACAASLRRSDMFIAPISKKHGAP